MTNGIDVSKFQGVIDWEEVKNHIDFVLIRCGYGGNLVRQDDPFYKRNVDECIRLNIPFGVYIYSYATNEQEALSEAKHTLRLIQDYQIPYPIYYDLEDPNTTGKQTPEMIGKIAKTFADYLEEKGYYVGIYASWYWFQTKLTSSIFDHYTKWIARYGGEIDEKKYDMWQYSQTGRIVGINAMVDLDYCFKDFSKIIIDGGYNNYNKKDYSKYNVGDVVEFNYVFFTSESTNPLKPYRTIGTITKVIPGARNPYLIGNDSGWVNDQVIERKIRYLSAKNYQGNSFVDALNSIHEDSSMKNRTRLANINGIRFYQGTQKQNNELLKLLKEGQLIA